MPSSTSKERFVAKLSKEQRTLHDRLILYQSVRSEDVCAWFLAKDWTVAQVERGLAVYKQDAPEAAARGNPIDNVGGYIAAAIIADRIPRNIDEDFNREHATRSAPLYTFVEVTKRYVKILVGQSQETLEFNQPKDQFLRQFDKYLNMAKLYA